MKQIALAQFPWPWLTAFALLIFFSFFIIVCIRVYQRSQKQNIIDASLIPLHDEVLHHE
jgi:cbb3-type cytochrome oxidase subunit 3